MFPAAHTIDFDFVGKGSLEDAFVDSDALLSEVQTIRSSSTLGKSLVNDSLT